MAPEGDVMPQFTFELILLFTLCLIGAVVLVHLISRTRRALSFSVVSITTYLLVYPVSGIAHLLQPLRGLRGYYDLAAEPGSAAVRISIVYAGFFALAIPLVWRERRVPKVDAVDPELRSGMRGTLIFAGLALTAVALPSLATIFAYSETVDSERIISLTGGLARVGFMSQWIAWGVSFLVIAIAIAVRRGPRPVAQAIGLWVGMGALAIAAAFSWTGGRTVVVMMALPLVIALWPWIGKQIRAAMLVSLGIAFAFFAVAQTQARTVAAAASAFDIGRLLDWEMGRYSMLGYAVDRVAQKGLLGGETLLEGMLQVPVGVAKLLGVDIAHGLHGITYFTAVDLIGDASFFYIVPGMAAEWYVNFGILGVVAAFAAVGIATRWVNDRFIASRDPLARLVLGYIGVLLIFCTFTAQSGSIFNYVLFTGLPALVLGWINSRKKRASTSQGDREPVGSDAIVGKLRGA